MKDYKIETKPSFWEVILKRGCYSDKEEKHLFFRANDENEVWNFLCRYLEDTFVDIYNYDGISHIGAIKIYGEDKKIIKKFVTNKLKKYLVEMEYRDEDEIEWDTDYGYAWACKILRLNVIEFKK